MSERLEQVPFPSERIFEPAIDYSRKWAEKLHELREKDLSLDADEVLYAACQFASQHLLELDLEEIAPEEIVVITEKNANGLDGEMADVNCIELASFGEKIDDSYGFNGLFSDLGEKRYGVQTAFILLGLDDIYYIKDELDFFVERIGGRLMSAGMAATIMSRTLFHETVHTQGMPHLLDDERVMQMAINAYSHEERWLKNFPALNGRREALDSYLRQWSSFSDDCGLVVAGARTFFIQENKPESFYLGGVGEVLDELVVSLFLSPEIDTSQARRKLGEVFQIDNIIEVCDLIEQMFNEYGFVSWEERLWAHSNGLIPGMVERLGMGWLYSF